jgi:hypothetical protein
MPSSQAFLLVWALLVVTMAVMVIIGLRVDRLRKLGRAPGAPGWFHPANSARVVSYVFSSAYKGTGDRLLAWLIPTARTCYVLIPTLVVLLLILRKIAR